MWWSLTTTPHNGGNPNQVLALYAGPFLPGAVGSWVEGQRALLSELLTEHLRQQEAALVAAGEGSRTERLKAYLKRHAVMGHVPGDSSALQEVVRVRCLGGRGLFVRGTELKPAEAAPFVAFLLDLPERRAPLAEVANAVFSGEERTARTRHKPLLSSRRVQLVRGAQEMLGPEAEIITSRGDWCLSRSVAWEADFLQVLQATSAEEVMRLYGGDFLPGLDTDWVREVRGRLREHAVGVLEGALTGRTGPGCLMVLVMLAKIDPSPERVQAMLDASSEAGGSAVQAYARQLELAMVEGLDPFEVPAPLWMER